jgi:hypothetical protein
MDSEQKSKVVRVGGEILVLHCWACGTAHSVNQESCVPGELSRMVCSNSQCRMSMFLVNELVVDDKTRKQMTKSELSATIIHSRFWK